VSTSSPETPAPSPPRPTAGQLALLALGLGLALLWPLALGRAASALGTRGLAGALVALSALSLALTRSALPRELRLGPAAQLALLALSAFAAVTGDEAPLRLVPAWVQLAVAGVFWRSLRDGPPVIERAVFWIQPHAPDFIRGYCRTETKLWGALFAANGVAIAALALFAPPEHWRAFASLGVWVVVVAVTLVDFAVRKLYFRLYGDGPLDRILARGFPPERTEMGRRANAYRTAKRLSLGRDPRTGEPRPRR
jgi:uncharacterized membrane protein